MENTMVRFGDVVHLNTDRIAEPLASGIERYVGLEHITPEDLHIHSWGLVAEGTTFTNAFKPGQVLFGKRRAYQRKVAVAEFAGVCSGDIYVFESKDPQVLLPELLPFLCQTEGFYEHAVGTSAGSLSPRTNWTHLAGYEFSLPPLDEQRRIADLLWAVDDENESINNLYVKLYRLEESFRFSVFSQNHNTTRLGTLLSAGKISYKTGPFGTVLKASSYVDQGIPVVNPINMVEGELEIQEGPFITKQEAQRLKNYEIFEGDLIFARKGDIGRGVFAKKEYTGFITGSDCIRVRVLDERIQPKYLFYFLTSPRLKVLLSAQSHGTTMPGINEKMLSRLEVAIPTVDEQMDVIYKLNQLNEAILLTKNKLAQIKRLNSTMLMHCLGY